MGLRRHAADKPAAAGPFDSDRWEFTGETRDWVQQGWQTLFTTTCRLKIQGTGAASSFFRSSVLFTVQPESPMP